MGNMLMGLTYGESDRPNKYGSFIKMTCEDLTW